MFRARIVIAFMMLGGTGSLLSGQIPAGFLLESHTETLTPKDHTKFSSWILSQDPSAAKKALLTSTITSTYYPFTPTITWYKASMDQSNFGKLLSKTFSPSTTNIIAASGNYDYTPDGAFWIDFANAKHFGGGFRSHGNVQEERMFDEFPQLPDLAYVLRNNTTIVPVTKQGAAQPFMVVSAERKFDVSNVPYGSALDSASPHTVEKSVVRFNAPFKKANIIGIAAKDYSKTHNARYSMTDLTYHLQAALLGDLAALQYNRSKSVLLHTGKWGSGAFKNSVEMITALQILAAEIAFSGTTVHTSLYFHGIDSSLLSSLQQEIVHLLQTKNTPNAILKILLEKQNHDPAWRPQG
jgi:hypothetical protein